MTRVSVVVCTWNRCELLDPTLERFHSLTIPPDVEWELLVVDNNSDDSTREVVARHEGNLPIRYLFEPAQGLSRARNAGVAAATGDLILFTDDDVLVDPRWLAEHVLAARRHPEAVFFGGTVEPWFEREPPAWIRRHLDHMPGVYAIRRLGDEVRPLAEDELPFGANMGARAAAFEAARFDSRLGRIGGEMTSGEETALFRTLRDRGAGAGMWVGPAVVRHFIPAERLTRAYVRDFFRGLGRTRARESSGDAERTLGGAPLWALRRWAWARVRAVLLEAFRGRRWFEAFREAAVQEGFVAERRAVGYARVSRTETEDGPSPQSGSVS